MVVGRLVSINAPVGSCRHVNLWNMNFNGDRYFNLSILLIDHKQIIVVNSCSLKEIFDWR